MAVKEKEYLLSIDSFKQPKVLTKEDAICMLLTRLIVLTPGADPLHPDMGVGIRQYRYAWGKLDELRDRVEDQISQYLPDFASTSKVELEITPEKLCNINITVDDVMYVYDSSEAEIPITIDSAKEDII